MIPARPLIFLSITGIGSLKNELILYLCAVKNSRTLLGTFEIDESIYQEMVKYYTEVFHLPPLPAKIYSFLIFDFDRKGITFDELVEVFKSSKSSVSCALQLLLSQRLVVDVTHADERKRHFFLNTEYIKIRFEQMTERLEKELSIMKQLQEFNGDQQKHQAEFTLYIEVLKNSIGNIRETLKEISN